MKHRVLNVLFVALAMLATVIPAMAQGGGLGVDDPVYQRQAERRRFEARLYRELNDRRNHQDDPLRYSVAWYEATGEYISPEEWPVNFDNAGDRRRFEARLRRNLDDQRRHPYDYGSSYDESYDRGYDDRYRPAPRSPRYDDGYYYDHDNYDRRDDYSRNGRPYRSVPRCSGSNGHHHRNDGRWCCNNHDRGGSFRIQVEVRRGSRHRRH